MDIVEIQIINYSLASIFFRDLCCSLKLKDQVFYIDKFVTWLLCCFKSGEKQFQPTLSPRFWLPEIARNWPNMPCQFHLMVSVFLLSTIMKIIFSFPQVVPQLVWVDIIV